MSLLKVNGKEYDMRLSFKSMLYIEDHYHEPIQKAIEHLKDNSLHSLIAFVWACLKPSDKRMTYEKAEDLVTDALDSGDYTFTSFAELMKQVVFESKIVKEAKIAESSEESESDEKN